MHRKGLRIEEALRYFEEIPSDDDSILSESGSDDSANEDNEELWQPQVPVNLVSSSSDDDQDSEKESLLMPSTSRSESSEPKWKRQKPARTSVPDFTEESGPSDEMQEIIEKTPIALFLQIFTMTFIESIVFESNLYSTQTGKSFQPIQLMEMLKFLAINLLMGVKKLPSYRDYWSTTEELHDSYISNQMPVKRFSWILSHLHLNNNALQPTRGEENFDKLYKVRPLLTHLQDRFFKIFKPGEKQAIDESMIKFKGRSSLKQYMPKKPVKRGYKIWMRCDQSGFGCQFEIYTGRTGNVPEKSLGERVVRKLCESLYGKNHKIYMDNFFTSYSLFKFLECQKTFACGTVNITRKNLPRNLTDDKLMKRGDFDWAVSEDDIVCLKWRDRGSKKKCVHVLSTMENPVSRTTVERKEQNGTTITVPCPQGVVSYNKNMGFVDHFDHLKSLYEIDRKSRKWWHRIFFHFLDVSVVNAYILYQQLMINESAEYKNIKNFRIAIISQMIIMARESETIKKKLLVPPIKIKGSKPHVSADVRLSKLPHIPILSSSRRCALCSTKEKPHRSQYSCSVCKVALCTKKSSKSARPCFEKFHGM